MEFLSLFEPSFSRSGLRTPVPECVVQQDIPQLGNEDGLFAEYDSVHSTLDHSFALNWLSALPDPVANDREADVDQVLDGTVARPSKSPLGNTPELAHSEVHNAEHHDSISIPVFVQPVASDVEDSWNEDEHGGSSAEYFWKMKNLIRTVASTPGAYTITAPLPLRLRKAVHLLAHLEQCSHVSFGLGPDRKMLIASDGLESKTLDFLGSGCFNTSHKRYWSSSTSTFWIDPRAVKIKNIPGDLSCAAFLQLIVANGAPIPFIASYDGLDSRQPSWNSLSLDTRRGTHEAFAVFKDVEDLNMFVDHFQHQRLRKDDQGALVFYYARVCGFGRGSAFASSHGEDAVYIDRNASFVTKTSMQSSVSPTDVSSVRDDAAYMEENVDFIKRLAEHNVGLSASASMECSDYSSAAGSSVDHSSTSMSTDYSSEAGRMKKRRRNPRIPSGYKCQHEGCDKRFSYIGERTKHERIHLPNDQRPYPCNFCPTRFLDAKDLRRHVSVHRVLG